MDVITKFKTWILYNIKKSFWVVYLPAFKSGLSQTKDSYVDRNGDWTNNVKKAKRF